MYIVAAECEIGVDLVVKAKSGVLESMKAHMVFLSSLSHCIRFVYTLKHSSYILSP